jgi:hypothetical protein
MHRVYRAFEAFDNLDQDLSQFVGLRIFPRCDQFLVTWSCGIVPWLIKLDIWRPWSARVARGTESFLILRFLLDQVGLSVCLLRDTWPDTWTCEAMRWWGCKHWMSHASLPVYFWLSVRAVRCCNHLDRPCQVFHIWGGKTCGTLIDRSRDAWSESGDTIGVVMSIRIRKCI